MPDSPTIAKDAPFASPSGLSLEGHLRQWCAEHPGESAFHLLATGEDALSSRLALMQSCQRQLDLQYYMFQDDLTGKLIIEELLRAADRGVKVRILLDDIDIAQAKEAICVLSVHPNIEFRIFNPVGTKRQRKWLQVAKWPRIFERYSKRMHNKAMIADGAAAIIGGRNLGDEYFGAGMEFAFSDLDVLMFGPVLPPSIHSFEEFWQSRLSFTLDSLGYEPPEERTYRIHRIALRRFYEEVAHMKVISRVKPEDYLHDIFAKTLPVIWAEAEMSIDVPQKVLTDTKEADSPPMQRLFDLLQDAREEFVAVSPYFIPGKLGIGIFHDLAARGVQSRILTNSLASTDVTIVHAGYCRYREAMLKAGVELYEMKPLAGKRRRRGMFRRSRSSRASLHAKVYVVDGEYVMIGSMNLDPRSYRRNTENAVTIRSKVLAWRILEMMEERIQPENSYRLRLDENGQLLWETETKGRRQTYRSDPKPGIFRRLWLWLYYHIAPESQL